MDLARAESLVRTLATATDGSAAASKAFEALILLGGCRGGSTALFEPLRRESWAALDAARSVVDTWPVPSASGNDAGSFGALSGLSIDGALDLSPLKFLKQLPQVESQSHQNRAGRGLWKEAATPRPAPPRDTTAAPQLFRRLESAMAVPPEFSPSPGNVERRRISRQRSSMAPDKPTWHDQGLEDSEELLAPERRDAENRGLSFKSALHALNQSDKKGVLRPRQRSSDDDIEPFEEKRARRAMRSSFVPPMRVDADRAGSGVSLRSRPSKDNPEEKLPECLEELRDENGELPERLRNVEPRLIEQIMNEILTRDTKIGWDDIAGLEHAKDCITETIIWPLTRPDLFQGTRAPSKGLLLFGPPGTGKTMIGRAIAGEIDATFFSISASSLTSKWIGEGEKLVRALFGVASCKQPAVIFIDEIDSLLSQRKSEGEHEASRRIKTQFLIEMEGCQGSEELVLVIGATNRPQELDEAARRRLSRRLYVPLPGAGARLTIVKHLLEKDHLLSLTEADLLQIAEKTEGYSGSDMSHLVREASMVPMREALKPGRIAKLRKEDVRPINLKDFLESLPKVRPSVSPDELTAYKEWNQQFGSVQM